LASGFARDPQRSSGSATCSATAWHSGEQTLGGFVPLVNKPNVLQADVKAPAGDRPTNLSKRCLCSTPPENKVQSPRSLLGCPIRVLGIAWIMWAAPPITFDSSLPGE